ncbi:YkvA family protein [Peribacillus kribbensis]|uniref:YkvA family protein n=1 Tax=Peribacillus kribbensis TaxID=356658 RepID=UPI000419E8C5|nr:YkvA family protein [Peribacillus kribbensis]
MLRRWLFTKIAYRLFRGQADRYIKSNGKGSGLLARALRKAGKNELSLKGVWTRLQLLFELVKAWSTGRYRDIPYRSLLMIVIGIIYFVSPIDFIPDFLFGLGILDDAAVLGFIVSQMDPDLNRFQQWKKTQGHTS